MSEILILGLKVHIFFTFEKHVYLNRLLKSHIVCDITLCSPVKANRRFGGTYRLHLEGFQDCLLQACFLLSLFFDPEDGDGIFLRNIGSLSQDYLAFYPRKQR
jgi:hypothetical protein